MKIDVPTMESCETIRILHECEVLIEKSVPRVTVWHHEALPGDAKLWPEGQICLSVPHTHDSFFFLHTYGCWHLIIIIFTIKDLQSRWPFWFWRHFYVLVTSRCLKTRLSDPPLQTNLGENVMLFIFYLTNGSESLSYTGSQPKLCWNG